MLNILNIYFFITGKTAKCSPTNCCYIDIEEDESVAKNFPHLMVQLVQRYFRDKEAEAAPELPGQAAMTAIEDTKAQLEEIKEMLRQLVVNRQ